jgi:hypothetical protein
MVLLAIPLPSCILKEDYRIIEISAPSTMVLNELHRCLPAIQDAQNERDRRWAVMLCPHISISCLLLLHNIMLYLSLIPPC